MRGEGGKGEGKGEEVEGERVRGEGEGGEGKRVRKGLRGHEREGKGKDMGKAPSETRLSDG